MEKEADDKNTQHYRKSAITVVTGSGMLTVLNRFIFSYLCFLQNINILKQIFDQHLEVLIKQGPPLCAHGHIRCKNVTMMNQLFQQRLQH